MIRTYSETLIALEVATGKECETSHAIITAEDNLRGKPKEVRIHFYGKTAEEVSERIVVGVRFTYRGYVSVDANGNHALIGQTFALIV